MNNKKPQFRSEFKLYQVISCCACKLWAAWPLALPKIGMAWPKCSYGLTKIAISPYARGGLCICKKNNLIYCSSIWCPTQETIENKFETFQKRCIKWILNEQFYSYSEAEYLRKLFSLRIMPLSYKFTFTDLKLFYQAYKGLSPLALPDYVVIRSNTRSSTNDGIMFGLDTNILPSNRKSVFYHSFFPRCISHWNSLPSDIRNSQEYSEFIEKLKLHIWESVASRISDLDIDPEPD